MVEKISRSKDKHDFWRRRFRHRDVIAVFKKRLFESFENQCFRCGATDRLQIDHHIPRAKGGRLEAGNLVILCSRCNNSKNNTPPDIYYSQRQLTRLTHLLDNQKNIFEFKWDWNLYNKNRHGYLLNLGVDPEIVERIFGDPNYEGYIGSNVDGKGYQIDVTDLIIECLEKMVQRPPSKNE